ncbi:MAG: hypothetical protein WC872_01205 [Candidatus Absconditabacterales bacterium]
MQKTNSNLGKKFIKKFQKEEKKVMKEVKKEDIYIGIVAMIMLIIGVFFPGGSMTQKILFLIGAPILRFTSYLDKQKVFFALEAVISIGALLAFFPHIGNFLRYGIMIVIGIVAFVYLIRINIFRKEIWAPIGALGLLCLAIGFATNAIVHPLTFNFLLFFGSLLMAVYSAIEFWKLKIKLSVIFLILNIIFLINPLIYIISHFNKI